MTLTRLLHRVTPRGLSVLAALLAGVLAGPAARAQSLDYPIVVEECAIGLPPGAFVGDKDASSGRLVHLAKRNQWAPIYLKFQLDREVTTGARVVVESYDAEKLKTTLNLPLTRSFGNYLPGAKFTAAELGSVPYVRCGDSDGKVTVRVLSDDGRDKNLCEPVQIAFQQFRNASSYVVLALGNKLPGFQLPGDKNAERDAGNGLGARNALRNGRVETASIASVAEMPDQWFGYEAADLVVLTTGSTPVTFLTELFGENAQEFQKVRRDALLEWVRRGGELVISVGSNAPTLSQLPAFQAILPGRLRTDPPTKTLTALPLYAKLADFTINDELRNKLNPEAAFPVANVALNVPRPPKLLMPNPDDNRGGDAPVPTVLQTSLGLGRVSLVAFDLDQSPFLDYPNRPQFWDYLLRECGSARAALAPASRVAKNNQWGGSGMVLPDAEEEWLTNLRTHVDTFDGVPVISFGWVALFIALYMLLIGPVEYLFLRHVLKRLELTWVTFPLIVVSVSAAAYFTAYWIKGNDLKLNKVDLIDVDVAGQRVYGRTWFSVFSPRIDSYTVSVEPREGLTASSLASPAPPPLVGYMAGGAGGASRLSRGYSYHADPGGRVIGDSLTRVPIQVWSTKAFEAQWAGNADPGTPPVRSELFHPPGDDKLVTGSFTSNLPFATLENPVLIYNGQAFTLPAIARGQRVDVPAAGLKPRTDYFSAIAPAYVTNTVNYGGRYNATPVAQPGATTSLSILGTLFHERATTSGAPLQNSLLRPLDQSWRLDERTRSLDEAILVATVPVTTGLAEPVMTAAEGVSPTLVTLRPREAGKPREPVLGTIRQETTVRVYLPIRPAGKR